MPVAIPNPAEPHAGGSGTATISPGEKHPEKAERTKVDARTLAFARARDVQYCDLLTPEPSARAGYIWPAGQIHNEQRTAQTERDLHGESGSTSWPPLHQNQRAL